MKRYHSRVDGLVILIAWAPMLIGWVVVIPTMISGSITAQIILALTMGGTTILLISIYANTYYSIDSVFLSWRTGPFHGKIEIKEIRSIKRYESIFAISSIMKPSLTRKPLKIQYAKYDDMPFSPEEESEFIGELKRVNTGIQLFDYD